MFLLLLQSMHLKNKNTTPSQNFRCCCEVCFEAIMPCVVKKQLLLTKSLDYLIARFEGALEVKLETRKRQLLRNHKMSWCSFWQVIFAYVSTLLLWDPSLDTFCSKISLTVERFVRFSLFFSLGVLLGNSNLSVYIYRSLTWFPIRLFASVGMGFRVKKINCRHEQEIASGQEQK